MTEKRGSGVKRVRNRKIASSKTKTISKDSLSRKHSRSDKKDRAHPEARKKKKIRATKSTKHRYHKTLKHKKPGIKRAEQEALREGRRIESEIEEEFFVPGPKHRGKYRIPLGIRFLIGYLTFILAIYVISFFLGISFPTTILFGKIVTGYQANIFNGALLMLIMFIIYGFWKRKYWSFDLAVSFFGFSALNSLLSLTLFQSDMPAFRKLMMLSFISLLFMNLVVIWYILHERKFFFAKRFHDRPIQKRDKIFLYTIVSFWVVALLIGTTLSIQFYEETKTMIDSTIHEMKDSYQWGTRLCDTKEGADKDICYLVLASAQSNNGKADPRLCNHIRSDFYRFSCLRLTKNTGSIEQK